MPNKIECETWDKFRRECLAYEQAHGDWIAKRPEIVKWFLPWDGFWSAFFGRDIPVYRLDGGNIPSDKMKLMPTRYYPNSEAVPQWSGSNWDSKDGKYSWNLIGFYDVKSNSNYLSIHLKKRNRYR